MNQLTKPQKEKIQSFINFVGANEKVATKKLKSCNWNLDQAVEEYLLENGEKMHGDRGKLTEVFNKYKDAKEDAITIEGLERFCNDIALDPLDPVMLVLAHALSADKYCEFTKQQFVEGFSKLGCDSLENIKEVIPNLRERLSDNEKFREVYIFAFNYSKEPAQRSLPLEIAVPLWTLLLKDKFFFLEEWCTFVQKIGKAISKDTWSLILDFAMTINKDLSNYDDDGAWPIMIDEFVKELRESRSSS